MKKDNFEEMLAKTLKEYVKDTEKKSEPVSKVEFSKRHEKNMEEIFKAVENGTLGNFEFIEVENDLIKVKYNKYFPTKFVRIVALIVIGLLISLTVAPRLTAWQSEDSEFYGENQDDYAWLLKNDTTEILESNLENSGDYSDIFGYLPEGFEIKDVIEAKNYERIEIKNQDNKEINFKIVKNVNRALDTKEENEKVLYIDGIEVKYTKFEKRNVFWWNNNNNEYQLYSEIDFEILYEILKNIKFKNF